MKLLFFYMENANIFSVFLRLFLATFLGGVIGFERELKRRPAGLRTFALVCIGSALAMITNEYATNMYGMGDPTRIAAQVISGVGFLGAGTIIITGQNRVKGLTTAASLWATAALGIAIGSGFYIGAILGFFAILTAGTLLHIIDERLDINSRVIGLYIEGDPNTCISDIMRFIKKNGYVLSHFEKSEKAISENSIMLILEINLKRSIRHSDLICELSGFESINFIEEIR